MPSKDTVSLLQFLSSFKGTVCLLLMFENTHRKNRMIIMTLIIILDNKLMLIIKVNKIIGVANISSDNHDHHMVLFNYDLFIYNNRS